MTNSTPTDAMVAIVELLTPLDSEERHRVVTAALTLLGDTQTQVSENLDTRFSLDTKFEIHPRVTSWLSQNNLSVVDLERVYFIQDDRIELIIHDVPGNNRAEKATNIYILCGIIGFLSEGTPSFQDDLARKYCIQLGCYDKNNHSKTLKKIGNSIIGNKKQGWTLTSPGLDNAAEIIYKIISATQSTRTQA